MRWSVTFFSFLFFAVFIQDIDAQDHKVSNGVAYFNERKFDLAVESLSSSLEDISILKSANISKAYYFYAKALFSQFQEAAAKQDLETVLGIDLRKVKENYDLALSYDEGEWESKISADLRLLRSWLIHVAVLHMNAKTFDLAKANLTSAIEIKKDYVAYDLLGQILMDEMDYDSAANVFDTAIVLLKETEPERPDILMAYVYYRRALISGYYSGSYDEIHSEYSPTETDRNMAIDLAIAGDTALENEWKRIQENSSDYNDGEWLEVAEQYQLVKGDLERLELDLLLIPPARVDDAIDKFENILERIPDDYTINAAYASLMEDLDITRAIKLYEKVISIDDSEEWANYNLGSIYLNMATDKGRALRTSDDKEEITELQEEISAHMMKAKPYFERCLEINPVSLKTVKVLKQISIQLGNADDYELYNQIEEDLMQLQSEP